MTKRSILDALLDLRLQHKIFSSVAKIFFFGGKNSEKHASQKSFKYTIWRVPYRKPTQVGKHEYAKVNGWNLVKELGKKVSVSSQ